MREIFAGLGGFVKPDPELIWLSRNSGTDNIKTEAEALLVEQEAGNTADNSEIDVSDMVDTPGTDIDAKEIDSGDLEVVADDEVFQQALDQVLKDR
ncbi:MAG: hypothetical protein JRJ43_12350 [Deltaproteobacteria bacterium]|nr:hypothetical protein [Deltaproteobacteria bacterium]